MTDRTRDAAVAGTATGADRYGRFEDDGTVYCITDPRTPRPWSNVIANPRFGLAVSQTGSGFTWIDNSQLAVLTNWQQDFARDASGKFLYVKDEDSGDLWSLAPAPVWAPMDRFACRHGLGFTCFETLHDGIAARFTLFAHAEKTAELWLVTLHNRSGRPRRLSLCAQLEWCCGVSPAPRREFHKLFIETRYDAGRRAVFAGNRMWDVASPRWGHWNTTFPYVAAFAASAPVDAALGDKAAFLGRYGTPARPLALDQADWEPRFGSHSDPIAALRSPVTLLPDEERQLGYVLAAGADEAEAARLVTDFADPARIAVALAEVREGWRARLAAHRLRTPDARIDGLANDWARYQAISARLWGRCGYYQQSGAFGFRDQLQDSQVWLTIDPERTREQLRLHAAHQFGDGSVYHWWHPLSEQGHVTKMTDDLLWLSFVTANYVRETGDLSVLDDEAPFLDAPAAPVREHVERAFARVFRRTGPRGLPYIGAGDWNDGLSAAGLEERGESVWLAHFLAGLLSDWAEIRRRTGDADGALEFETRRARLVEAINAHGWDGGWYSRGTLDDGTVFGSRLSEQGKIYLNAQTWAVLNDVAPPDRARDCMDAVRDLLVSEAGALLLAPAYDTPRQEIGYITRYAPGLRENGGVYSHAATWAIAAAAKVKDAALVERLLFAMSPAHKDADRYEAEPYVLPGNVDGPASPHHGRAGWTWYTGSAAWFHRVVHEWVLGVRPEWDGLRIEPCLPPSWPGAEVVRPWRGATYRVRIERGDVADGAAASVELDGQPLPGTLVPPPAHRGERHAVRVIVR